MQVNFSKPFAGPHALATCISCLSSKSWTSCQVAEGLSDRLVGDHETKVEYSQGAPVGE